MSNISTNTELITDVHKLNNSLDNFFKRFVNTVAAETGKLPVTEHHPDWPSACQQGELFLSEQMQSCIHWQPLLRAENDDLSGLEKALEIPLHTDLKSFFTRYWSDQIDVIFQQGNLKLMFIWNDTDMERLIKNQLGHALNKLRNKQSLTFFIACTDSDYIISLENDSGRIVLERPGYAIEKVLAENLNQFINELEYGRLS